MIGLVRRLIGGIRARPVPTALRLDPGQFARQLCDRSVIVIAAIHGDGIDPEGMTKEQLLSEIERAARDLDENEDGFAPLVYERGGRDCIPFFTDQEHAETFCGEYSKKRNRVFPFQVLTIQGSVLASLVPGCDVLVQNDWSPDQHVMSDAEVNALRCLAEAHP